MYVYDKHLTSVKNSHQVVPWHGLCGEVDIALSFLVSLVAIKKQKTRCAGGMLLLNSLKKKRDSSIQPLFISPYKFSGTSP